MNDGFLHPLIPADAGIQTLPHRTSVRFDKVWIPASAGMSGWDNSFTRASAEPVRHHSSAVSSEALPPAAAVLTVTTCSTAKRRR